MLWQVWLWKYERIIIVHSWASHKLPGGEGWMDTGIRERGGIWDDSWGWAEVILMILHLVDKYAVYT